MSSQEKIKQSIPETPENKAEIHEKEPLPKKVFVEIGPREMPVTRVGARDFKEDEIYVGIEKSSHVGKAKEETEIAKKLWHKSNKNAYFLQADAGEIPLKSKSAEEVFLANVYGDPDVKVKGEITKEIARVLKDDGKLVILEDNTPIEKSELINYLTKSGLVVEKIVDGNSQDWEETIKPYHHPMISSKIESYIVFASLKHDQE